MNSDALPMRQPAAGEAGPYRLGYRPDIEGLRAVAILLVVAAHAGVPWLAGGFVGVDVFFVLSGYLITGLLVQEMRATGGVRLLDFYARRLRRLLPALLVMVVGTAGAAAVLLAPLEQPAQARVASAAALWLSNLHFVFSQLDYFGPAAGSNLFLHTWSLGVEEQFYLVWPLLVLFLAGSWRWQAVRQDWSRLLRGMLGAVGICLVLSVFLTFTRPEQGFYLMPSRAWQFALGAVTVLAVAPPDAAAQRPAWLHRFCSAPQGRALGWIGLALVVGAGLLLDTQDAYPGMWAVLPSLGTALLLAAVSCLSGVRASESAPPVGKITFSLGTTQRHAADGTQAASQAGVALHEGDRLVTGADGWLHLRMVDDAFVALRPGSTLRITVQYTLLRNLERRRAAFQRSFGL